MILLDTCTLLWLAMTPEKLSPAARKPAAWIERARRSHALDVLPLEMAVALRAAALPRLHNDPFDRLLIATAQEHHLVLLTPDPKLRIYPALKTRW